jgi:hypothetical protein
VATFHHPTFLVHLVRARVRDRVRDRVGVRVKGLPLHLVDLEAKPANQAC